MSSKPVFLIDMQDLRIYDKHYNLLSNEKKDLDKGVFIAYFSVSEDIRYILRETTSKVYQLHNSDCINVYFSAKSFIKYDQVSTLWYLANYDELKIGDIVALTLEEKIVGNDKSGGYLTKITNQSNWNGRMGYNSEDLSAQEEYEYLKNKDHPSNFFKRD